MKSLLVSVLLFYFIPECCISQISYTEKEHFPQNEQAVYTSATVSGAYKAILKSFPYKNEVLIKADQAQYDLFSPVKAVVDTHRRHTYVFSEKGGLLSELIECRKSGTWENRERFTFSYDEDNNLISQLEEIYTESGGTYIWKPAHRITSTYDSSHKLISIISELMPQNEWIYGIRRVYSYGPDGRLLLILSDNWDSDKWTSFSRDEYAYPDNGNKIVITRSMREQGDWKEFERYTETFSSGRTAMKIWETRQNGGWMNVLRHSFNYSSTGKPALTLYENWENGEWHSAKRYIYSYDGMDNMTEELAEVLRDQSWAPESKKSFSYDANNNCIRSRAEEWNGTEWLAGPAAILKIPYNAGKDNLEFFNAGIAEVEYNKITLAGKEFTSFLSFTLQQNYPNPFNSSTTIEYSVIKEGYVKLSVYDALGRLLKTLTDEIKPAGKYSERFNADGYPSGVYFCRLESGGVSLSRKLILLK